MALKQYFIIEIRAEVSVYSHVPKCIYSLMYLEEFLC